MVEILRKVGIARRLWAMSLLLLLLVVSLTQVRPAFASSLSDGGFEGISCSIVSEVTQCGAWMVLGLFGPFGTTTSEHHSQTSSFFFNEPPGGFGNILQQRIGVVVSGEALVFWVKGSISATNGFGYRVYDIGTVCGDNCPVVATFVNRQFSDWTQIEVDLTPMVGHHSILEFWASTGAFNGLTVFLDDVGITSLTPQPETSHTVMSMHFS